MRKGIILLILLGLVAGTAFADFSRVSVRLQGVNPNLSGIMSDEYTDALDINPADLLNVEGYRVFTNMSNLYGGGGIGNDRALNGATTGGVGATQFLLGGFGHPLKGVLLPDGQMGLLYNNASDVVTGINNLGGAGETVQNTITQTDVGNDGSYGDTGDSTVILDRDAKREIESYQRNYELLFAHPLNDVLKLGIVINTTNTDLNGNASSKEPIEANDYTKTTTVGVTNPSYQDNSLSAEETNTNSVLNIGFGGRYQLTDIMDIGARVNIAPVSQKKERESTAHIYVEDPNAVLQPYTAEATAVDGNLHTIPGGYGVLAGNVTAGFAWTGNYSAAIAAIPGVNGNEIGSMKQDGTGLGLIVDSHYDLNDDVKLIGRINFQNIPQDLSADLSRPYTETLRSNVIAGDKSTEDNNTVFDISGDVKDDVLELTLGGQAELEKNILLGFGLIYNNQVVKTDGNYVMNRTDVSTYDGDNDGEVVNDADSAADNRTTITDKDSGTFVNDTKTNTFQFPIGLEMKKWNKVAFRLGVTHQIQTQKVTATTTVTDDGLWKRVVDQGGVSTTTYENAGGGKDTSDENTNITETTTRITQYYYGLGYNWSENISFDILGLASGINILDLNDWRIGCTMKF